MTWPRRLMIAVLAAVLVSVPVAGPTGAATAAAWRPNPGAHFNMPRTSEAQWRLERIVVNAINHAHRGSYIKISLFSFDRRPVARALIRAYHRGVHVQVLANDHQFTRAQGMLKHALGRNRAHKSWSRRCTHGCRSNGDVLHSKFFLFGHTGAADHTVMVGSVNLTYNAVHNQYNDLWVSNGRRGPFNWFNDLFKQEAKDVPSYKQDPPHRANENWPAPRPRTGRMATEDSIRARLTRSPRRGSLLLQAIPWPRYNAHNDPIMDILDRVHCYGATGGTGGSGNRTIVRVNMHTWGGDRGAWLARKVRSLYADGCHVQLMYGFAGAEVRDVLARPTSRGYVPVRSNGFDTDHDGFLDLYTHQKELLISGHYGSQHKYRLSITGSSNYTGHGLTGDEILFLIHRHWAYNAYTRNFKEIWQDHTHPVHYQPSGAAARTRVDARTGPDLLDGLVPAPQPKPGGPAWESD
ncbi:MAG TPA: phospholipase D-like domain-containing protein [Mycobacteriales bacterium]|nr:phospholipase D-like domain-containing protein [Mycobacteriales bacterium]